MIHFFSEAKEVEEEEHEQESGRFYFYQFDYSSNQQLLDFSFGSKLTNFYINFHLSHFNLLSQAAWALETDFQLFTLTSSLLVVV